MTHLKATLLTAAVLAIPFSAFAQISTDKVTDEVKTKAVDTVLDNMTTDDAITAGKVMIKGGSKEDAAKAVVKDRIEDKLDNMVGDKTGNMISTDDLSKNDLMTVGKEMAKDKAMEKASGSSTTYKDKAESVMTDKAHGSAKTYGDKMTAKTDAMTGPEVVTADVPSLPPVACPAGTVAQADGTCLLTDDGT